MYRLVERRYLMGLMVSCSIARPPRPRWNSWWAHIGLAWAYPGRDHLPPTLTPQQIEARTQQSGPLRLLFVGNLTPVKGLHTLLQALGYVPSDLWCLTVGSLTMDLDYVHSIRQQIDASGWHDRVRLLGACPNAEVATHLMQHQVLAVPSLYEAFGIAYLEARVWVAGHRFQRRWGT